MNLMYLKYAVTIAETGGMIKAAEKLTVAQSNLSRAIKELESELGIKIFFRTSKGMTLTTEGDELIRHAKTMLAHASEIEDIGKKRSDRIVRFSVSVPRDAYVCEAFDDVVHYVGEAPFRLYFKETNAMRAIENVLDYSSNIGIIRTEKRHEKYFFDYLTSKDVCFEPIGEYCRRVFVSKESVLANKQSVNIDELKSFICITYADISVPFISSDYVYETEPINIDRQILVVEIMSALHGLLTTPNAFILMAPVSEASARHMGLAQIECSDYTGVFKDLFIWRNGYKFSELDRLFMSAVRKKAEECGIRIVSGGKDEK